MAIHTSAITYTRGLPKNYNNFFFVAQANNTIISPLSKYIKGYQFYNRNITNTSTTYNNDGLSDFISINSKLFITKLPIINNGKDKLLYLNIVNNINNINIAGVYICKVDPGTLSSTASFEITDSYNTLVTNNNVQKIDNFVTSYDNPFARFFNSHINNRYISTIIPANIITNNFIYVILQSQITTGTSLSIREIGTHDLFPSL